jgi:hypothetical protein
MSISGLLPTVIGTFGFFVLTTGCASGAASPGASRRHGRADRCDADANGVSVSARRSAELSL